MAIQIVPQANIRDVEAALVEMQGRTQIKQLILTVTQGVWTYRPAVRGWAKCEANTTADGVSIKTSFWMPTWLWILFGVLGIGGLFLCVVPGVFVIGMIGIRIMIMGAVLKRQLPKLAEAVKQAQSKRTDSGIPPVLPSAT